MCFVVQNDVPRSSVDKDMHCKCTGQMGAKKYLRKSCYYVERIPEQCCLGRPNSQRACEGVRWDKHSSSGLDDRQVEGQDHSKGDI